MPILRLRNLIIAVLCVTVSGLWFPPNTWAAMSDQEGASIVPNSPSDFSSSSFAQSVQQLARTHATSIDLVIPYYQSNNFSTDIQPGWNTPSDASLLRGIHVAEQAGLSVMLTVHLDSYAGGWRAEINPGDRSTWFTNYGNVISHYARLAQQSGVSSLCLGAELYHMTSDSVDQNNTNSWRVIIQQARANFSGLLTYSANWGAPYNEKDAVGFWPALDEIGISAYFSLATQSYAPSVTELTNSWEVINRNELAPLQARYNKPILFTEVGYESAGGAHYSPGMFGRSGVDLAEQKNDYEALLSYWSSQPNFNGLYLWDWSSNPAAGGSGDSGFTPQNKPAQAVMAKWFSGTENSISQRPLAQNVIPIWWPLANSTITGVQPFRASLSGVDPSMYSMYWQVDDGVLNAMSTSYVNMPHKESLVDLSNWNWQPSGQYKITFVAKDAMGYILAKQDEMIGIQP